MGYRNSRVLLATPLGILLMGLIALQVGCTSLFFYPDQHVYITPDRLDLEYDDVWIKTPDGETLHAWWLPAQGTPRGHVYFLHGNAQNISSHILNVTWLPEAGYNVLLMDYRGYGQSTGAMNLEGALHDSETGLRWLGDHTGEDAVGHDNISDVHIGDDDAAADLPVYMLGQSLGGALAITLASEWVPRGEEPELAAVIVDSAFSGFRAIAREKLGGFWLTWPFQIPLSWTIPREYEGTDLIHHISPVPVMIIHSVRDGIIPIHHGLALYEAAEEPKTFLRTDMPHAGSFVLPEYQEAVLEFLENAR